MLPKWGMMLVAGALVLTACSDSGVADSQPAGSAATRVLTGDEVAELNVLLGAIRDAGSGIALTSCSLYYPGRYLFDFEIESNVQLQFPAKIYMQPLLGVGGRGVGLGSAEVMVVDSGSFRVPVGFREFSMAAAQPLVGDGLISAEGGQALGVFTQCNARAFSEEALGVVGLELGEDVDIVLAPTPVEEAQEGSIQALARQATWTEEFEPWSALATIDGGGERFFADRLLIPASGWADHHD